MISRYTKLLGMVNDKKRIEVAKLALELVSSGETVMIESGSCCALFADEINCVLTDDNIPTDSKEVLLKHNVYIQTVSID